MRSKEDISRDIVKAESSSDLESIIKELNKWLKIEPDNIVLLEQRAAIFEKLQQYGNAINDFKKIIEIEPDNNQARVKIDMLKTILRYTNTDIYASPNTNMDPWLE